MPPLSLVARTVSWTLAVSAAAYVLAISLIVACPSLEAHAIYMHRVTLMSSVDSLNTPEEFGFLPNQVRPFSLPLLPEQQQQGEEALVVEETLHAWHVLPLNLHEAHHEALLAEPPGHAPDVTASHGFWLLKNDPAARVVLFLHGASGTMASGVRPMSYRAISAGAPSHIHVLSIDYRGYGLSSAAAAPTESGMIADAVALARFAMHVAGVPPERILVYAHSLGTAVALGMVEHFALHARPPVEFAGLVLAAAMVDLASLVPTYRINGMVPVAMPLAAFPSALGWLAGRLRSTWRSGQRLETIVRTLSRHHITLLHAEDDSIVAPAHAHVLYRHAVNATMSHDRAMAMSVQDLDAAIDEKRLSDLGTAGASWEWTSERGVIRKSVVALGQHDKLTIFPVTSRAVLRAFRAMDPTFGQ